MAQCCIPGCTNELPRYARLRTCATCRQSLHSWEKRRPAEILDRSQKLAKYTARMSTFAVVKDNDVHLVARNELERKRIMLFPMRKAKKQARANVVAFKLRKEAK